MKRSPATPVAGPAIWNLLHQLAPLRYAADRDTRDRLKGLTWVPLNPCGCGRGGLLIGVLVGRPRAGQPVDRLGQGFDRWDRGGEGPPLGFGQGGQGQVENGGVSGLPRSRWPDRDAVAMLG
jgi:hypothetical protein